MIIYDKSLAWFGVNNGLRDELDTNWLNLKNALLSDDILTRWIVNKSIEQLSLFNNFDEEHLSRLNNNIDKIRAVWGEVVYDE